MPEMMDLPELLYIPKDVIRCVEPLLDCPAKAYRVVLFLSTLIVPAREAGYFGGIQKEDIARRKEIIGVEPKREAGENGSTE